MNKDQIKYRLKKPIKYGLWSVGVFVFLSIVMAAIENQNNALVKSVTVTVEPLKTGEILVDKEDVFRAIETNFGTKLKAVMIEKVETDEVEKKLEEVPFIADADVFFDAKNQLFINVVQREPIVRIIDNNGFNYYLDKTGKQIPLSTHSAPRVLVITGEIVPYDEHFQTKKEHQLLKLFNLVQKIEADPFFKPMIEQIDLDRKGQVRLIPKLGEQDLLIGDLTDLDEKFKKLKKVYSEVLPRKGWRLYKTIDVSFKNQAICRK